MKIEVYIFLTQESVLYLLIKRTYDLPVFTRDGIGVKPIAFLACGYFLSLR